MNLPPLPDRDCVHLPLAEKWKPVPGFLLLFLALGVCVYLAMTSYQMDLRAYYVAGKAYIAGLDPYVNNLPVSPEYLDPVALGLNSRFYYPPQSLLLFAPLSLLDYPRAKFLFTLLLLICLLITMYFLGWRGRPRRFFPALLALSFPVLASFERGQVDIIILLLVVLSYTQRDRWYSPLLLSIAISVKLVPVLLLVHFVLIEEDLRYVIRTVAFTSGILLLSLTVIPGEYFSIYAHRVLSGLHVGQEPVFQLPAAYTIVKKSISTPHGTYAFSHSFIHGKLNILYFLGAAGLPVAMGLVLAFQFFLRRRSSDPQGAFYSNLVVIMLANRLMWIMGMVYYIPFALLTYDKVNTPWMRILVAAPLFLPRWPNIPVIHVRLSFILSLLVIVIAHTRDPLSKGQSGAVRGSPERPP